MKSRKVKIIVLYRDLQNCGTPQYTTTFIIDECYLLEFLPSFIREDIEEVKVEEYNE